MKRLLVVVLMIVCSSAWAEWELADLNDEFFQFVDKSSIRKDRNIVKMWSMKDYLSVQTNSSGSRYQSSTLLVFYDCKSETSAIVTIIQYSGSMGKGSAVWIGNSSERELEWLPISPQSVGQVQWKIACGRK